MRGTDYQNDKLFSYVRPDSRVPADHPLRTIRRVTDTALTALSPKFAALYPAVGRPSIPPEKLLRALLLQAFYTIRSERQLMEQLNYNLLFRWFVGLSVDEPVWVPTVFSHNRDRLLAGDVAAEFLDAVLNLPEVRGLLSAEHFSVDGTLIQAWASMKSFRRKDGNDQDAGPGRNGERDFHNDRRSNETHASTTDPDARLAKKSKGSEAKLAFTGHLLMENRNGLLVDARLTHSTGTAECKAALDMLGDLPAAARATVGADKAYDTARFVSAARDLRVTPHVAQNITAHRGSTIDGRTTRHDGYRLSQTIRKQIEEANGWIKEVAGLAQTKHRGLARVGWMFTLKALAYNLVRLPKLLPMG
ncbi:IS5 family transposase [Acidisoma sp. L85]|uniref:IS5 family transposase n=1 Tax=Acidisoma sp. L85 TaxID=1641850 RepID=UPI00131D93B6|nr:IS5 family transposase [Acidisoma sp. L85]